MIHTSTKNMHCCVCIINNVMVLAQVGLNYLGRLEWCQLQTSSIRKYMDKTLCVCLLFMNTTLINKHYRCRNFLIDPNQSSLCEKFCYKFESSANHGTLSDKIFIILCFHSHGITWWCEWSNIGHRFWISADHLSSREC